MNQVIEQHYRVNYSNLVKKLTRILGSDGEDAVQEAYARALKYFPSYNPDKDFDKWFNKIVFNVVRYFKADRGGLTVDVDPDYLEDTNTPSQASYNRLINILCKDMKEEHVEIIKLHFECGYRPREIDQVSDLTLTNIRTILSRFRLVMKGLE